MTRHWFSPTLLFGLAAMWTASTAAAPPGGSRICTASGVQSSPAAIADGAGGAYVTWLDSRRGVPDLYAHHLSSSAVADPAWPEDGVVVSESGNASGPTIFRDGAGGAHVVWFDNSASAITAQRIRSDGTRDPAWPANGRQLVVEPLSGPSGRILRWDSDNAGNLYVCWNTFDFTTERLWLHKFNAAGVADWPAPVVIGTAGLNGSLFTSARLSVSLHGAFVGWSIFEDLQFGSYRPAHLSYRPANGDPGFQANLVEPYGDPFTLATVVTGVAADPAGGAFVRQTVNSSTYLLRLDATGAFVWPFDRTIATDGSLVPDDAGGIYGIGGAGVVLDRRASDGTVPAGWTGTGLMISEAQTLGPVSFATIPGGILLCWSDATGNRGADIRAIGMLHSGVPGTGWSAGGNVVMGIRSDQTTPALAATSGGQGVAVWRDLRKSGGDIYGGGVAPAGGGGGGGGGGGPVSTLPAENAIAEAREEAGGLGRDFAIGRARLALTVQSPAEKASRVSFTLARDGDAWLELIDVAGRLLERRPVSGPAGVTRSFDFELGTAPRGLYWLRLRQNGEGIAARLVRTH